MSATRVSIGLSSILVTLGCGSHNLTPLSVPVSTQPTPNTAQELTTRNNPPQLGPDVVPRVQWRFQTGGRIVAAAIEVVGGNFVVGSLDGTLYRINAHGGLVYSVDTGAPIRARALALSHDTVLVGNENGDLLCLDSRGEIRWRRNLPGPIAADPIAGSDHTIYAAADGIYALDIEGNVRWHHVEPTTIYDPLAWNALGQLIFRTVDGRVVTLDTQGQVQSTVRATPSEAPPVTPRTTLDAAGIAYAVGPDQVLRATRDDGSELWGYSLGVNVTASVLLAASGTLLIGTDDGNLYALH